MLAEFMENAATFSPPTADVRVTGSLASRGYAIDVEDRGLGMTERELADANARLAQPPMFDLSGSDRLGLHVAAQLAHRHGIRITLRGSPYGGTTAIVLIPNELVVRLDGPDGDAVLAVDAGLAGDSGLAVRTGPQPGEISGNGRVPALSQLEGFGPAEGNGQIGGNGQIEGFAEVSGRGSENGSGEGSARPDPLAPAGRHAISTTPLAGAGPAGTGPAEAHPAEAGQAVPAPPAAAAVTTENGLPVRVRQQGLAPPLRHDPAMAVPADPAADSRSPDAARRVMSAFWQGRTRGLSEADHEQANGTGRPDGGQTR
jgi:hypothetical protein